MEVKTQTHYDKAVQFYHEIEYKFWLGASYLRDEEVWVWDSNRDVMNMDEFWEETYPTSEREEHDCVMMIGE